MLLLRGDVRDSLRFHAFAPIFIVFISILIVGTILPRSVTEHWVYKAESLERETGVTTVILVGLMLYWLARLLIFPAAFAQLIRG